MVTIFSKMCAVMSKDDLQNLCCHEYLSRCHLKNFSTQANLLWLLQKHSSTGHIGVYAEQIGCTKKNTPELGALGVFLTYVNNQEIDLPGSLS